MRSRTLLFLILCLCPFIVNAQFFHESFLTSDLYSVTMGGEGNDGKSDYFQRVTNDSIDITYNGTDSIFFACQDIDDGGWEGSESPSQMTWSGIDIKGKVKVRFEGLFAEVIQGEGEIDRTDGVVLQYQIDDMDWENLIVLANDGSTYNSLMYLDSDFDAIGDSTCISSEEGTMVKIEQSFFVWGDTLALRISVNLNSGKEDIAFDEFMLFEETVTANKPVLNEENLIQLKGEQLIVPYANTSMLEIFTIAGKKVLTQNDGRHQVDIGQLKSGIYIVRTVSDKGVCAEKVYIK